MSLPTSVPGTTTDAAPTDAAPTGRAATDPAAAPPSTTAAPPPSTTAAGPAARTAPRRLGSRWIEHWDPEDATFWRDGGRAVARRNLRISMFAEFLGFSVWALWSIVVPQLAGAGFALTVDQQFWLVSVPSLVGATLRIPYTFAVTAFGGRNWTIVSALLLLLPTTALAVVVQDPTTSFGTLLAVAALAGFGGGNFASSMANISFFYPEKEKGRALGMNAAGGNLGTAAVQLAVPLVVAAGAGVHLERAGLMMIPFVVVAAFLAWRFMDNLATAHADTKGFAAAARSKHTWIVSFLYIGTFGSFIGYSGAFPTLLKNQFPGTTLQLAFLGALVGSVARPFGGTLADRVGGTRVTIASYVVMALGAVGAIRALDVHSVGLFFGAFLVLFVASGVGNGSIYRMIPAIFRADAEARAARSGPAGASADVPADVPVDDDATVPVRSAADRSAALLDAARKAGAGCIGIAGAVGAFGGFLIPRGFAASTDHTGSLVPALWTFVAVYGVMAVVTWAVYQRRGSRLAAETI